MRVKDNILELIGGIKLTFTKMGKTEEQSEVRGWSRLRGSVWDLVSLRCLGVWRSLD